MDKIYYDIGHALLVELPSGLLFYGFLLFCCKKYDVYRVSQQAAAYEKAQKLSEYNEKIKAMNELRTLIK